ncbi:hypothetical protein [Rhodopirellula sp. SWK7]|uniref:hypothetical protein n=1 Tax=Rhodopirellula sp. SWK7 TaxID=595460 RepID=UPI0002BD5F30|nr:hypothetical protein [Rhodopirellula sp. SWK7]EMI47388.1 hypothetical protein RRSWK_00119 [Rhodopirellula sp. SWK7]
MSTRLSGDPSTVVRSFVITGVAITSAPAATETGTETTKELIEHSFKVHRRRLQPLDPPEDGKLIRAVDGDTEYTVWNSLQEAIEVGDRVKFCQEDDGTWSMVYKECV